MALPYQSATTGQRALLEIQEMLQRFGCTKFATGSDFEKGEIYIQFEHRGRPVLMSASARGYAAAWLKHNPYNSRRRATRAEHEQQALRIGNVAVYSILRDWVKGQITAIEIGVMSFEAAFLSHMMLPSGQRVIDELTQRGMLALPGSDEQSGKPSGGA